MTLFYILDPDQLLTFIAGFSAGMARKVDRNGDNLGSTQQGQVDLVLSIQ